MLNMVASGSAGKTLNQFLEFLGYEAIDDLNDKSWLMMSLLASSSSENTRNDNPKDVAYGHLGYELYLHNKRVAEQEQEPLFSLVNALWVDHGFRLKSSFQDITKTIYKAQLKNVDLKNQVNYISFIFIIIFLLKKYFFQTKLIR